MSGWNDYSWLLILILNRYFFNWKVSQIAALISLGCIWECVPCIQNRAYFWISLSDTHKLRPEMYVITGIFWLIFSKSRWFFPVVNPLICLFCILEAASWDFWGRIFSVLQSRWIRSFFPHSYNGIARSLRDHSG